MPKKKKSTKTKSTPQPKQEKQSKNSITQTLANYSDEELEEFMKQRRRQKITPNLDEQIKIMVTVISEIEKLEEHPFRDNSFGHNILERQTINANKDYYARLIRERDKYGEKP